jgi:hypothetical protein
MVAGFYTDAAQFATLTAAQPATPRARDMARSL